MRKAKIKTQRDSDNEMLEMFSHKFVQIPSSKRSPSIYKLLHSHWEGKKKKKTSAVPSPLHSWLPVLRLTLWYLIQISKQQAKKKRRGGGGEQRRETEEGEERKKGGEEKDTKPSP